MKRKILLFAAFALLLCLTAAALALPSFAQSESFAHVFDDAGLLTESQKKDVEQALEEYSRECGCFIAVMTTNYSPGGFERCASDKVDELRRTEGDDIYLLYIDMGTRDYRVETHGSATKTGSDKVKDYLEGRFQSKLSSGNYVGAFKAFGDGACKVIQKGGAPKSNYPVLFLIIGMLAVGLISGAIYTSKLKKELKSVEKQTRAANYVVSNSLNVTLSKDIFLYSTVTKTPKPKPTSSSGGGGFSGGGSSGHGGFSGKF